MTEYIQWARLAEPETAIRSISWTPPTYMYLERVPEIWLSDDEVAGGVRFELLDPETPFGSWERGRVFCSEVEMRWEKLNGAYQSVVVGNASPIEGFSPAEELDLAGANVQICGYQLWGQRVEGEQLDLIGTEHEPNRPIYLELRVPRLLRYPVSSEAHQVRLKVREYVDPKSGELLYYRFLGLEEVA